MTLRTPGLDEMRTGNTPAFSAEPAGYLHPAYARALNEFGTPCPLRRSGGWLLRRAIPGTPFHDAMCCYPYLTCTNWSRLADDLRELGDELVSFAAVPDPFGGHCLAELHEAFPDRLVHIKDHFVADLSLPPEAIISSHHQRESDRAMRKVKVILSDAPTEHLNTWLQLFAHARSRFAIRGIRAFSREVFARHLALPGAFMSLAYYEGEAVAAHIQLVHGDVAYAHMAADAPLARKLGAAYALYRAEIEYFSGKAAWIDWGGEAGLGGEGKLSAFKAGWSTGTRPAYFCGRIMNPACYAALTSGERTDAAGYFPAYRSGEFA